MSLCICVTIITWHLCLVIMWLLTMNEKVIETEERPNDNLVQKPRAMMSSHVTQMLAIIDMFIKTM